VFIALLIDPNKYRPTPVQILPPPAPLAQTIGDAQSVVLANGIYMQADCCTKQSALLDSKTLTWTPTGRGKYDDNDEEGWNLLPNGEVLMMASPEYGSPPSF
jgi:hypothetical protein